MSNTNSIRALQAVSKITGEEQDYRNKILENKFLKTLNTNMKAKVSIPLGMSAARAFSMASTHADKNGVLSAASPYVGSLMAGLMPLQAMSGLMQNKQRLSELEKQKAVLKNAPDKVGIADALHTSVTGGKGFTSGMSNLYMAMMAASAFLPDNGLISGAAMRNAAYMPYLAGGLTKFSNPYGLLSAVQGAKAYFTTGANPITAGMAGAAKVTGGLAASGLTGLGNLTGIGALGKAGAGLNSLIAGASPGALMAAGIPLAMLAPMLTNKVANYVKEKTTPNKLLKSGASMRPVITPSRDVQKQYALTLGLDKQIDSQAQQGHLDFKWWSLLKGVFAIERQTSQLGFLVEFFQKHKEGNRISANMAQNHIQAMFGQTGYQEKDLPRGFISEEDKFKEELQNHMKPIQWLKQAKYGLNKGAAKFTDILEITGSFLNPMDYIAGGENNPFRKLKKMQETDKLRESLQAISKFTGISMTFMEVLNQPVTALLNKGKTAADKTITVLSGIYELTRFSAFQLKDIASALGVDSKKSFMNVVATLMDKADEKTGESEYRKTFAGKTSSIIQGIGGSRLGALGTSALGAAAFGPLGLFAGMFPALLAGEIHERESGEGFFKKFQGKYKGFKESINSLNLREIMSVDTTQKKLGKERELEEENNYKIRMYNDIHLLAKNSKRVDDGLYINFSTPSKIFMKDLFSPKNKFFKDVLGLLDGIEENTDWLEEELILLNRCCSFGTGFSGRRRKGAGYKNRGRRRTSRGTDVGYISTSSSSGVRRSTGTTLGNAPKASMAKKAKYFATKGAGRFALPAGLSYLALQNIDLNSNAVGNTIDSALTGAMTGAMIGSMIPIVGTAAGAILGALVAGGATGYTSMYNPKTLTNSEKLNKVSERNRKNRQARYKSKFELDHTDLFHAYGDEGDYKIDPTTGRVLFFKRSGDMEVYDVKSGRVITNIRKDAKSWMANKKTKANEYIQEKAKYISGAGGDPTKIDTKEEIEMLLASISKDQGQIAQMSLEQQNAIIEILTGLIKTHAAGADKLIQSVDRLHMTVASGNKLGSEVKPGGN